MMHTESGINFAMYIFTQSIFFSFLTVDPPSFTLKPSDKIVKESEGTMFLCNATGNPAPEITWIKDGKTVAHGDSLSILASRSDSGKYWCLAENGLGLAINISASLDVQCK